MWSLSTELQTGGKVQKGVGQCGGKHMAWIEPVGMEALGKKLCPNNRGTTIWIRLLQQRCSDPWVVLVLLSVTVQCQHGDNNQWKKRTAPVIYKMRLQRGSTAWECFAPIPACPYFAFD
jgi:hypothetical protein